MLKRLSSRPYLIITLVYIFAHFFILLLTGCWWDDLTFINHDLDYINLVATQSGRPEWNLLIPFCWSLWNNGKLLIFVLYYFDAIFLYQILKCSNLFAEKSCLLITLLFIIIPVNEARILISNFPYAVGLFIFFLSFMLFIKWKNGKYSKNIVIRILLLFSFFMSYILNSILSFYYIVFIYLFFDYFLKDNDNSIIHKTIMTIKNVVVNYIDFFVLPFVFFILKKVFLPTSGKLFENYNSVTLKGILKCIKYIPLTIIDLFYDIFKYWISFLKNPAIIVIIIFIIIFYLNKKDKDVELDKSTLILLLVGLIVLSLGLFPYVEIRGKVLTFIGVNGRDAILTPLGTSFIIFSLINTIKLNKVKNILLSVLLLLGIVGMNCLYIEWQKDYYHQLGIQYMMKEKEIECNDTFYLANINETNVDGERFYSLNTNSYLVHSDKTRLFISEAKYLFMLEDKNEIEFDKNYYFYMNDYNPDKQSLDAVIIYENTIDTNDTLLLKYYEFFDTKKFYELIMEKTFYNIYTVDDKFTNDLLDFYHNNQLNSDEDVINKLELYD